MYDLIKAIAPAKSYILNPTSHIFSPKRFPEHGRKCQQILLGE